MSRKKEIDQTDREIINILQKEGDIQNKDLAERIGKTAGPTLKRVQNLKKRGYIQGFQTKIDTKQLGYVVHLSIHFTVRSENADALAAVLSSQPKIRTVLKFQHGDGWGMARIMALANVRSEEAFKEELEEIRSLVTFKFDYKIHQIKEIVKESLGIPV